MKVRRQVLLTIAAVVLIAVGPATATASPGPAIGLEGSTTAAGQRPGTIVAVTMSSGRAAAPSAAELEDLAVIAEEESVTLGQAVSTWGTQGAFNDLVEDLRQDHPEAFADASFADGSPWVAFVDSPPAQAVQRLQGALPVAVEVRGGAPVARRELEALAEAAHRGVRASNPGSTVLTTVDTRRAAVSTTVSVTQPRQPAPDSRAEAQRRARGVSLVLRGEPAARAGEDTLYGGYATSPCTSGFAAYKLQSVAPYGLLSQGLLTAAHCSGAMTYDGRTLTFAQSAALSEGDVQYRTRAETSVNRFYHDVGALRSITGTGRASTDTYLCRYGKTTGKECDRVRDTYTCRDSYCGLMDFDYREADSGDSGGPWFYGNTGYGIHSGYHYVFPRNRDQLTPLTDAAQNMRVLVRVS